MNVAWLIYQRLAQSFPHEFNLAYGDEVTQLGEEVVQQIAKRHGVAGLMRLIADIAMRVPLEYLSEMRRDMRYAFRALVKSPGFALVGILSMAIGIGLTTNVYSTRWALVFGDLPAAANAKRLAMAEKPVSYYYIEQYRQQKNLLSGAAAFLSGVPFNVSLPGQADAKAQRMFGQLVSPDYFLVLGVQPQRGRVLSPALDKRGDPAVVVISDRFWRNRLNSSPDAIGQILRINGQNATIVGITPENFNGALGVIPAELFVPITAAAGIAPELANDVLDQHNAKAFLALMCLAPGVSIDTAEAGLDTITRRLDQQDSSAPVRTDKGRRVTLMSAGTRTPLPRNLKRVIAGFFIILMGLVVTLACANLANMLIARSANRRKELAIRLAVGASRFRFIRQMIAEGVLLSLLGGVAGFALAYILGTLTVHFTPPADLPFETGVTVDWHAAIFAFILAVICGVAFTLAPALQAVKTDVVSALKEGSALQLPGYRRLGLRNLLMTAQVAGSLMLLLITGFLVIGISKGSNVQTNFDPNTMCLLSIDPARDGYTPEKTQAFFDKLPDQLKTVAAVRSVAFAGQTPFSIPDEDAAIKLSAEDPRQSSHVLEFVAKNAVGAGYFSTLSQPLLAGREFDDRDQRIQSGASNARALPAILNESAARRLFPNENAIGKRVRDDKQSYEIVGVVRDLKNGIINIASMIYVPLTQRDLARPPAGGITVVVRSDAPTDAVSGIRNVISSIDPNLTIFNVQTLKEYLDRSRAATRFSVQTYAGIGVFGLILAAIGLAGITAYAVARRRREIGIRTALGATKAQTLRLVLREGTALVVAGTVLGMLGAFAIGKSLSALANIFAQYLDFGMNDPRLLIGAPLLLAAVTMLACFVPARKSALIDPLQALRSE